MSRFASRLAASGNAKPINSSRLLLLLAALTLSSTVALQQLQTLQGRGAEARDKGKEKPRTSAIAGPSNSRKTSVADCCICKWAVLYTTRHYPCSWVQVSFPWPFCRVSLLPRVPTVSITSAFAHFLSSA